MPRVVKEYAVRRNEILDAAQRLISTKGYERMTIQDILDDLHIAKGLFYYYFLSKQAMLVALTERMMETSAKAAEPVVENPDLSALDKLQGFFATIIHWETEQKEFLLILLPVWFMDENAVVREKMRAAMLQHDAPQLAAIVQQGVKEGSMHPAYPDQAGNIAALLFQGLKESLTKLLLSPEPESSELQQTRLLFAAYTDALEHVLGIPAHTLNLVDSGTLSQWFGSARDAASR